jgi:hypothetical protein
MTTPKEHDGREGRGRQEVTSAEQEITSWIRNILKQYEPGDEISAKFLYAKLFAHPERYGAPGVYGLPKLDKFEQVCRAMFFTRTEGGELIVRVQ